MNYICTTLNEEKDLIPDAFWEEGDLAYEMYDVCCMLSTRCEYEEPESEYPSFVDKDFCEENTTIENMCDDYGYPRRPMICANIDDLED